MEGARLKEWLRLLELNKKGIGMHSCVIEALGPLLTYKKRNRNVLNIPVIRIGSPKMFFKSSPFPHTKSHLIVASLWSLILPKFLSFY